MWGHKAAVLIMKNWLTVSKMRGMGRRSLRSRKRVCPSLNLPWKTTSSSHNSASLCCYSWGTLRPWYSSPCSIQHALRLLLMRWIWWRRQRVIFYSPKMCRGSWYIPGMWKFSGRMPCKWLSIHSNRYMGSMKRCIISTTRTGTASMLSMSHYLTSLTRVTCVKRTRWSCLTWSHSTAKTIHTPKW